MLFHSENLELGLHSSHVSQQHCPAGSFLGWAKSFHVLSQSIMVGAVPASVFVTLHGSIAQKGHHRKHLGGAYTFRG